MRETSHNSKHSTFPTVCESFVFDSSLNREKGCVLRNSTINAFLFGWRIISYLSLPVYCSRLFSSSYSTSARDIPWILKSILGSNVISSATSSPVLSSRWAWPSCWTCHELLRIAVGVRRDDKWIIWYRISSVFVCTTFSRQLAGTGWSRMIALEHFCPNANSLSWALFRLIQNAAFWFTFHFVR